MLIKIDPIPDKTEDDSDVFSGDPLAQRASVISQTPSRRSKSPTRKSRNQLASPLRSRRKTSIDTRKDAEAELG